MKFNPNRSPLLSTALQAGDTIGIVAPAGPFDKDLFNVGIETIRDMGFEVKIDEGIYARHGYLAGDDRHRVNQFNAMMVDEKVQAVMCARGGYGVLRILDEIDFDTISRHPKPLIGFSDITALHQAIFLRTGMVTFHGPMVTTLALCDAATAQSWLDTLRGNIDLGAIMSQPRILKAGAAEGVLTGGNLASLCHLLGTAYSVDFSNVILLIEDVGEAPYRIDRMLTQMKIAGIFDEIQGVIVGTFENCGSAEEIDAIIAERFQGFDIPVVSGVPVGHGKCNLTLPLGVRVRLDTRGPELCLLEPAFKERP